MKRVYVFLLGLGLISCLLQCGKVKANEREMLKVEIMGVKLLDHPRLLFTSEDEIRVRKLIGKDELVKKLVETLKVEADKLTSVPQIEYKLRELGYTNDLLMTSREYILRLFTLSMAHRLIDNEKYLPKIEETLNHICLTYPNWNPQHYLDVSEMTTAVAVAYDWCYNELSETTRKNAVDAIKRNALDLVVEEYEKGGNNSWAKRETNWNVVCNSGMVIGALATAEFHPEITEHIIKEAVKYIPNCMKHFAPDGVCYEGPAYWGYTNIYLSMLLKTLDDNVETCLGIDKLEGVEKTARSYIETISPAGCTFNFGNCGGVLPNSSPIYFYFSRKFDQADVAIFYRNLLDQVLEDGDKLPRHFVLSLAWFDDSSKKTKKYNEFSAYRGINDILVLRGNPSNKKAIFLSAKGGDPDQAHQQLDAGSFVLEREGIRWFDDLGADAYSLPGFWDYRANGQRWSYFRNSNLSHNTLFIDNKIQYSRGESHFSSIDEDNRSASFNLTEMYKDLATDAKRTFTLSDDRNVLITDNVTVDSIDRVISWNAITKANVEIKANVVTLEKGGKQISITFSANAPLSIRKQVAKTYTEKENELTGYTLFIADVSAKAGVPVIIKAHIGEKITSSIPNIPHKGIK